MKIILLVCFTIINAISVLNASPVAIKPNKAMESQLKYENKNFSNSIYIKWLSKLRS